MNIMTESVAYTIRPAKASDEPFLWEMLYQSLYVAEGGAPYPREVLSHTHIARYVRDWGRTGDMGFIAIDSKSHEPIGAVWCRLPRPDDKGFAYIGDETPEMGIALLPEHRGRGIGTALIKHLLQAAEGIYPAIALSVSPDNPAMRLYERLGFVTVEVRGTHPVMKLSLKD